MSLTKSDKDEIKKLIAEALAQNGAATNPEIEREGIKSESTGLIIAPKDYTEGDKKLFTWSKVMEIEKNAPDGWRLPTIAEWGHILAEFGEDEDGELDVIILKDKLKLELGGWYDFDDKELYNQGSYGYYWSRASSASNNNSAMYFNFSSNGNFYLQNSSRKHDGYAVRLVKEGAE